MGTILRNSRNLLTYTGDFLLYYETCWDQYTLRQDVWENFENNVISKQNANEIKTNNEIYFKDRVHA